MTSPAQANAQATCIHNQDGPGSVGGQPPGSMRVMKGADYEPGTGHRPEQHGSYGKNGVSRGCGRGTFGDLCANINGESRQSTTAGRGGLMAADTLE